MPKFDPLYGKQFKASLKCYWIVTSWNGARSFIICRNILAHFKSSNSCYLLKEFVPLPMFMPLIQDSNVCKGPIVHSLIVLGATKTNPLIFLALYYVMNLLVLFVVSRNTAIILHFSSLVKNNRKLQANYFPTLLLYAVLKKGILFITLAFFWV